MIGPDGGTTQVIEQGGAKMIAMIQKKDPFKEESCRWQERCLVKSKADCMDTNCVYTIKCTQCQDDPDRGLYVGQTGGTLHRRQREHHQGLTRGDWKCPLYRHTQQHHPDEVPDFMM